MRLFRCQANVATRLSSYARRSSSSLSKTKAVIKRFHIKIAFFLILVPIIGLIVELGRSSQNQRLTNDPNPILRESETGRVKRLIKEAEELWLNESFTEATEKLETALKIAEQLGEPNLLARCLNL